MVEISVTIRRANNADLPFVMATERTPGFEQFIGQWNEQKHRSALASAAAAYFVGSRSASQLDGFAIVLNTDDPHGNVFLKRVAVRRPNHGFGTPFLRSVVRRVFEYTEAYRFWLDVLDNNDRALHVYRKIGFLEEGVMRKAWRFADGTRRDLILMSLLRPEWVGDRSVGDKTRNR